MSLTVGQSLSFYEILGPLGAGGMGEVYRAKDTRLEREVAIKVLPGELADDDERLRRFEREAKTLASLNHPNVAGIHGVDQEDDVCFLALELVPGEDLASRLARGPLPIDEALEVCRQIAEGLEAAHEAGVVHRDLKPANVRITPEGVVKLLDFGLAKPLRPKASKDSGVTTAESDSFLMTEEGLVLGTPTYMSPEQARGKPVDRRTDIWAFGCVLFECLTGARAFGRDSLTDVLAAIVGNDPDWAALPSDLPGGVRRLLSRCLVKDPRRRLRDVGEARIEIEAILAGSAAIVGPDVATSTTVAKQATAWSRALPWVVVALLLAVLALETRSRTAAPIRPTRPARLEVRLTPGDDLTVVPGDDGPLVVLSPDGSTIVYLADSDTGRRLYLRRLDELHATPIAGTENASAHFFSPDGEWIAYFANEQLMSAPLAGGHPTVLAPAANGRGGSWGPDNTIVFAAGVQEGLSRVPSFGGAVESVTTLEPDERTHRWPWILPNGEHVLFSCQNLDATYDEGTIEVASIESGERKVLIRGSSFARYVDGHLLYSRGSTLYAVRFDAESLETSGDARPVLSGMSSTGGAIGSSIGGTGAAQVSIANDGTAVYLPGVAKSQTTPVRLAITDRSGETVFEYPEAKLFRDPRLSPDGKSVAVRIEGASSHLHLVDLERGTLSQITFENSTNAFPTWSNDGRYLAFVSDPKSTEAAFWMVPRDASEAPRFVGKPRQGRDLRGERFRFIGAYPSSFSPDDQVLIVNITGDVDLLSVVDGTTTPFFHTANPQTFAQFSPDGKWVAFLMTDEAGIGDIYVRAYPSGGALRRVSTGGGVEPHWTRNGREIVYLDFTGAVMAVDVTPDGDALTIGTPRMLFDRGVTPVSAGQSFDAAKDGDRFALLLEESSDGAESLRSHATMIVGFLELVREATAEASR